MIKKSDKKCKKIPSVERFPWKCNVCGERFDTLQKLQRHISVLANGRAKCLRHWNDQLTIQSYKPSASKNCFLPEHLKNYKYVAPPPKMSTQERSVRANSFPKIGKSKIPAGFTKEDILEKWTGSFPFQDQWISKWNVKHVGYPLTGKKLQRWSRELRAKTQQS